MNKSAPVSTSGASPQVDIQRSAPARSPASTEPDTSRAHRSRLSERLGSGVNWANNAATEASTTLMPSGRPTYQEEIRTSDDL